MINVYHLLIILMKFHKFKLISKKINLNFRKYQKVANKFIRLQMTKKKNKMIDNQNKIMKKNQNKIVKNYQNKIIMN
jgi:hypothetical protein